MVLNSIILLGGSGLLGKHLQELWARQGLHCVAPPSAQCNVADRAAVEALLSEYPGTIVVHAAALTDVSAVELDASDACDVNVAGTINVTAACRKYNKRLVFISTDYVFAGHKGMYKTTDPIDPVNKYAMTKAAGELVARTYDNSLVIRTSFCELKFPHKRAFVDQYTSRDYVDVIAPLISRAILSGENGIKHVGTERKTVYDLASRRSPGVGKLNIRELPFSLPADTSLDLS